MALGNLPMDTVITNGTLFNVFMREFIKKQSIWVNGKALVEPRKIFFGEKQPEMGKTHPYD